LKTIIFFRKHLLIYLGVVATLIIFSNLTFAAGNIVIPAAPRIGATSFILQDFHSGRILAEKDADKKLPPASLTKIMTVYVVFRELANGHLSLDEKVTVSKKAWQTPGSRMFIEVNKQVSIENLLHGVIIQSGNDASVALAEHVAGDEATFAELMNQHANRLGMTNTHFTNSMGLPSKDHYSTARDLAILTHALIQEFPEYYKWNAIREFTYNNITQHNRNKLLWRDESVDGVKTGYTEAAGYCLVASAVRNDMRLISVVLGSSSANARANENQSLLNYGFRFFETHRLYEGNKVLSEAKVWKGASNKVNLGLLENLYVTIPRKHYDELEAVISVENKIIAPISQGEPFGTVQVTFDGEAIANKNLVALNSVDKGSFFQRLYDEALLLLK
jgi:serine-type D-Ala-D-Ala carboxypeptidase (penicillin-binding protein 5/6)